MTVIGNDHYPPHDGFFKENGIVVKLVLAKTEPVEYPMNNELPEDTHYGVQAVLWRANVVGRSNPI